MLRSFPGGEARGEALLEGGAADFEGGGEELVVDGPGLLGDDDEAELLVVLELGVDGVELGEELGFDVGAVAGGCELFADGRREDGHGEGSGHAAAEDGDGLEEIGDGEELFDLARSDVLAFGGLELFLEAADEAEAADFVDDAAVAGAEEAVVGEDVAGELGIAVVAEHVHGALDLDFAVGGDAGEGPGAGVADVADAGLAGQRDVGDAGLGHAIAFEEVEAHPEIPLDDLDRDGGSSGTDEARSAEAEVGEDFLADDVAEDRNGEKEVELLLVDLLEDALLEADVEAGDGEEDGGAGADEVGEEGGLAFGEEDVHGGEEGVHLDDGALGDVGEGKVGEDAVDAFDGVDAEGRLHGLAHEGEGAEGVDGSLGLAGGAGGVDDGGDVVGLAKGVGWEGGVGGDDVGPEGAAGRRVRGAQLGKATKGRSQKTSSARGRGFSSEPMKQATGWLWRKSEASERSRAEGKKGTLTWPAIQMAKSAMIHQAQFLETMTMLEPAGQFWASIHAAMRRVSCMALAQDQSRSWPLTGWVKRGCDGRIVFARVDSLQRQLVIRECWADGVCSGSLSLFERLHRGSFQFV